MDVFGFSPREGLKLAYFRLRYSHKPPAIYYDTRYRCYVYPQFPEEYGELLWVCSEVAQYSLYYPYEIEGSHDHSHDFMQVLLNAYNYADTFHIPETDRRSFYSEQELEWIDNVKEQGLADRDTIPGPIKIPIGNRRHIAKMERTLSYYNENYGYLPLRIYYDQKTKHYVHMGLAFIGDNMMELFEYLGRKGYCLPYQIDGDDRQISDFDYVLLNAYDFAGRFTIPEAERHYYSHQQLEWINKMIKKGLEDSKKRRFGACV